MNQISKVFQKSGISVGSEHIRRAEFFITSKNYYEFLKDSIQDRNSISSLILECSAHGSFKQREVADRFLQYLVDAIASIEDLKKLKIKLSGFDLKVNQKLIERICSQILKKIDNYTSLEIRMTNLKNCKLNDFVNVLAVGVNIVGSNLQNLTYQFSDWSFMYDHERQVKMKKILQNKKQSNNSNLNQNQSKSKSKNKIQQQQYSKPLATRTQPTFKQFKQSLQKAMTQAIAMGKRLQPIKKFRLQISTWYYDQNEYQHFFSSISNQLFSKTTSGEQGQIQVQYTKSDLSGKKITSRQQYFHNEFTILIKQLLQQVMINLTNLQLDLRNWNKKFQMNNLKSSLTNINNQSKQSVASAITLSKRQKQSKKQLTKQKLNSIITKQKPDQQQQQKGNQEKQEQKKFDILIII